MRWPIFTGKWISWMRGWGNLSRGQPFWIWVWGSMRTLWITSLMIIGCLFRLCSSTSMSIYPSPALTVTDRLRVEPPQSSLHPSALPLPPYPHPQSQSGLVSSMASLSLCYRQDQAIPLPRLSQSPPPQMVHMNPSSGRKGHLERMKASSPYQQCKPLRKETHKKMWAQFQIRQYLDMNGLDGVVDHWGKYLDRYGWEVDHDVLGCCDSWSDHAILDYYQRSIYSPSHPLHICPDYSDYSCDS